MFSLKKYSPIGLVIIIVALISVGYFFVYPEYQNYVVKKQELDIKDEEIAAKEKYLPKLEMVADQLLEYVDQISIVEAALPFESSVAALSNYFQKTVSQNGLILRNVDVSGLFVKGEGKTGEEVKNVDDMLFSATATGSYNSFKSLLLDIYLSARIIGIDSFSLSSAAQSEGESEGEELIQSDLLDYTINLRTQSYNISIK